MSEHRPFRAEKPKNVESTETRAERTTVPETAPQRQEHSPADPERLARQELRRLTEPAETAESASYLEHEPAEPTRITAMDKQRAYSHTLKHVQRRLGKTSRRFSRFIHQPAIERASESLERTVARPSGILGAGLTAALGLSVMSYFARRHGFSLSGSELALFLAAGWTAGLLAELLWRKVIKR